MSSDAEKKCEWNPKNDCNDCEFEGCKNYGASLEESDQEDMSSEQKSDYTIRKVKVLQGRAKEEAEKQGLSPEDLVIVTTTIEEGSLPEYRLEKVEGDPVSFLLKHAKEGSGGVGGLEAKTSEEIRSEMVVAMQKDMQECGDRQRQFPKKRVHLRHRNADRLGKIKWVRLAKHQQQIQERDKYLLSAEKAIFKLGEVIQELNNANKGLEGRLRRIREHLSKLKHFSKLNKTQLLDSWIAEMDKILIEGKEAEKQ